MATELDRCTHNRKFRFLITCSQKRKERISINSNEDNLSIENARSHVKVTNHLNYIDLNMKMEKQCRCTINLKKGDTNRPDNSRCQMPLRSRFHAELSKRQNESRNMAVIRIHIHIDYMLVGINKRPIWYLHHPYTNTHTHTRTRTRWDPFHSFCVYDMYGTDCERKNKKSSETEDKIFCRFLSVCCVKLIEWIR